MKTDEHVERPKWLCPTFTGSQSRVGRVGSETVEVYSRLPILPGEMGSQSGREASGGMVGCDRKCVISPAVGSSRGREKSSRQDTTVATKVEARQETR